MLQKKKYPSHPSDLAIERVAAFTKTGRILNLPPQTLLPNLVLSKVMKLLPEPMASKRYYLCHNPQKKYEFSIPYASDGISNNESKFHESASDYQNLNIVAHTPN